MAGAGVVEPVDGRAGQVDVEELLAAPQVLPRSFLCGSAPDSAFPSADPSSTASSWSAVRSSSPVSSRSIASVPTGAADGVTGHGGRRGDVQRPCPGSGLGLAVAGHRLEGIHQATPTVAASSCWRAE